MISTTSPSPATRRARTSSRRARGRPVASAARSSSLSRIRAAAAADRTVSGRRAPGMATIAASRSSSQASAISAGAAPRAAATCAKAESPGEAAGAARSAERRVGHDDQPGLEATLDDTAAERGVVERAQRNLDRRQRSELERLVELRAIDVGDADARSQPVFADPSERANRRPPRNPRVGSVQQIEVDRQAGERGQARLAVSPEGAGPPVRYPVAARSRHAALRDDPRQGRVASTESAGEQPLVVPELGLVAPVGPGGVEDGDAAHRQPRRSSRRRAAPLGRRRSRAACSQGRPAARRGRASSARPGGPRPVVPSWPKDRAAQSEPLDTSAAASYGGAASDGRGMTDRSLDTLLRLTSWRLTPPVARRCARRTTARTRPRREELHA